jgi:tetratricopeptide (TPR) repeat protein
MLIHAKRYTSGRIALANLSASIEALKLRCIEGATFEGLAALSTLLFLRGDLLGRIADHDHGELVGNAAVSLSPSTASAFHLRARLAGRFHRFEEAKELLLEAGAAGHPRKEIDGERAALLQATGQYQEALLVRERLMKEDPGIHTIGAFATLVAEMGEWPDAEAHYGRAVDADEGMSPIPCAQLLFEWAVNAMRHGDLDRAEQIFADLEMVLPAHVPGRGHRAEVALARGRLDDAVTLITPPLEVSDDPEYRATYAEILSAQGDRVAASEEAECAAAEYDRLLARRPEAYADHAAAFFLGIGNRPRRAVELARTNWELRDTPRSRGLLQKALRKAHELSVAQSGAA